MENHISSRFKKQNFRYPTGAVPSHSNILFEIQVPRYYALKEIYLVYICDVNNHYEYVKMAWKGIDSGRDIFEKSIEVKHPGLIWYYFQCNSLNKVTYIGKGNNGICETDVEPASWQISVYDESFTTPDWIKGGLYYHIFVDRFAKDGTIIKKNNCVIQNDWEGLPVYEADQYGEVVNNDFFGGNLKGIISKLDYLQSLHVTCLYLSPIFEAFSNHKYDTADYSKIDPMFGSLQDFNTLCMEGEKRGIHVLLDGVFNHTGSDSVYFNKKGTYDSLGAYQSQKSDYYKWFNFSEHPDRYESWWGIDTLPSINEEEPSYVEFITGEQGIARRWIEEGASGWRLDVVDELSDAFLEKFRRAVKSKDKDALIIGEVWEDASYKIAYGKRRHYLLGKQLDSVMNYPFMNAIIQFIRYGDAENLNDVVTSICQNYPPSVVHCLMNIIGTHDTRRALTALGGKELSNATKEVKSISKMTMIEREKAIKLLKLAALIQMTLPGVPCIYYGDEAGMEGYEDPLNRRGYPWGKEDKDLVSWYRKLGAIRQSLTVFRDGSFETVYGENQVFLFQRANHKQTVIVGVNRSEASFDIVLEQPYKDLLFNKEVKNKYIIKPNGSCLLLLEH